MLTILLATCETSLEMFKAADHPIDTSLVAELEKLVEHTRRELTTLRSSDSG